VSRDAYDGKAWQRGERCRATLPEL
jgi:hypothetical protein